MEHYPAAERLAALAIISDDMGTSMADWRDLYTGQFGREPGTAEVAAARKIIEARADGQAPPLPPSASSSCWRLPKLEHGIPGDKRT